MRRVRKINMKAVLVYILIGVILATLVDISNSLSTISTDLDYIKKYIKEMNDRDRKRDN